MAARKKKDEQGPCWRVGTLSVYIISGLCIAFFLFCAVMAGTSGQMAAVPPFIAFVLFGLACLLLGGTTELTDDYIRTFTPLGSYELAWSEITGMSVISGTLLFFAPGKQLYVPSTQVWSGKNKYQAYEFLAEKLDLYRPPIVKGPWLLIFSRNCKRRSTNKRPFDFSTSFEDPTCMTGNPGGSQHSERKL